MEKCAHCGEEIEENVLFVRIVIGTNRDNWEIS